MLMSVLTEAITCEMDLVIKMLKPINDQIMLIISYTSNDS